tara:strand:- start:808 stop:1221 length:414 start_codon:yes stop_codon:yes gene_type:complete
MYIRDISQITEAQAIYHIDIGTLTVFDTYIVAEFNEGLAIGFDNGREMLGIIYDHFSDSGNFGFICNRVHAFSMIPTDLYQLDELFTNSPKIAIINYSTLGRLIAEYERSYWPFPIALFNDLSAGIIWVDEALEKVS